MADDCGNCGASRIHVRKDSQESLDRLRLGQEPHSDLGSHAERSLGTGEHASEVIARRFPGHAAQIHYLAVLQNHLHAQNVIGGGAVGQAVGPAGILGNVAAQATRFLAGWVRGVAQTESVGVGIQVQVDHSRLDRGRSIFRVHFQDMVHSSECDLDASGGRDGASA